MKDWDKANKSLLYRYLDSKDKDLAESAVLWQHLLDNTPDKLTKEQKLQRIGFILCQAVKNKVVQFNMNGATFNYLLNTEIDRLIIEVNNE